MENPSFHLGASNREMEALFAWLCMQGGRGFGVTQSPAQEGKATSFRVVFFIISTISTSPVLNIEMCGVRTTYVNFVLSLAGFDLAANHQYVL